MRKFFEDIAGLLGVVPRITAEKDIEIDESLLRPGMNCEMRFGNYDDSSYASFGCVRAGSEFMETRSHDLEPRPLHHLENLILDCGNLC